MKESEYLLPRKLNTSPWATVIFLVASFMSHLIFPVNVYDYTFWVALESNNACVLIIGIANGTSSSLLAAAAAILAFGVDPIVLLIRLLNPYGNCQHLRAPTVQKGSLPEVIVRFVIGLHFYT